ncbi:MAG: molecular chaperone DnaJ [bacterium]|nr:molecular chaperone DnaJ [bacterium]
MATKRDYYEILEITREATSEQIKEAYKKLARKYHPDMNTEKDKKTAEEKFKEVSEAYEVLIDPNKRQMYDMRGHEGVDSQFGPGGFTWDNFTHQEDLNDIVGNLFKGFFGGGFETNTGGEDIFGRRMGRGRGGVRGQDVQLRVTLTLQEIYKGVTKEIRIRRYEACPVCKGFGGTGDRICNTCKGTGQIRRTVSSIFGQMVNITTCNACRGRGKTVEKICAECKGKGKTEKVSNVSVKIPAGVKEGNYIVLKGQGNAGSDGGPAGDLIVVIEETEDPVLKRDNNNLIIRVPISFPVATLGGSIEVPIIDGKVLLTIPKGTPTGKVFRLHGKGMPVLNGYGRGDELVEVYIDTPKNLSREAEQKIKELGTLI